MILTDNRNYHDMIFYRFELHVHAGMCVRAKLLADNSNQRRMPHEWQRAWHGSKACTTGTIADIGAAPYFYSKKTVLFTLQNYHIVYPLEWSNTKYLELLNSPTPNGEKSILVLVGLNSFQYMSLAVWLHM